MNRVFLGLGSNVGLKSRNIASVIRFFFHDDRFNDVHFSSLYETKPYGEIVQDNFINAALSCLTDLTPNELFFVTKDLEKNIGRKQRENWGPREIDIDILLFSNKVIRGNNLYIPHEDLLNRDFVMVPLLELDEEIIHPVEKKKIKLFLSKLTDKYIINKINFNYSEEKIFQS